jgi:hypothetical protein
MYLSKMPDSLTVGRLCLYGIANEVQKHLLSGKPDRWFLPEQIEWVVVLNAAGFWATLVWIPLNFVTDRGHAKIMDFGLAKMSAATSDKLTSALTPDDSLLVPKDGGTQEIISMGWTSPQWSCEVVSEVTT